MPNVQAVRQILIAAVRMRRKTFSTSAFGLHKKIMSQCHVIEVSFDILLA